MDKTTRREFIKKSGFTLVTVGVSGRAFLRHMNLAANSALTAGAALSPNDHILVVIQESGGNDGLNTVIPMSSSLYGEYRRRRPSLAVQQDRILPLSNPDEAGNLLGFHPNLARMKILFDQGQVSVIQSVGYQNPNRSHFDSMAIWHTADPVNPGGLGWLGESLDVSFPSNDNPLIAVSIGRTLPVSLRGKNVAVPAIENPQTYRLQTDDHYPGDRHNRIQTLLALNREQAPERLYWDIVGQTALDTQESSEALQAVISRYTSDPNIQYPTTNPLARGLLTVAQIIAGDLGTKILYVTLGGFDTHGNQNGQNGQGGQPLLLQHLDEAVDAFYQDMKRLGKDDKVLIMTWSEFGRKVGENGNLGTDHGASAPQFVIGSPVQGGIIGEHPSLTNLDRDDGTVYSIDFRSYYATILETWLEVDSREILGGSFGVLPFI